MVTCFCIHSRRQRCCSTPALSRERLALPPRHACDRQGRKVHCSWGSSSADACAASGLSITQNPAAIKRRQPRARGQAPTHAVFQTSARAAAAASARRPSRPRQTCNATAARLQPCAAKAAGKCESRSDACRMRKAGPEARMARARGRPGEREGCGQQRRRRRGASEARIGRWGR